MAAIEVADERGGKAPLGDSAAIGAQPAAEHPHHLADMLADDDVADADLAQLAVHIVDEALGERGAGQHPGGLLLEPQQHDRQHRRDHVEPAVDRVRDPAFPIPMRQPRARHRRLIQRRRRARVLPAEQPLEKGHRWSIRAATLFGRN